MSSPANEPAKPKKVPGWRQPWDPWRIVMTAGAVILLAFGIARGYMPFPRWFEIVVQTIGFVLLAVGFGLAMKLRREIQEQNRAAIIAQREKELDEKGQSDGSGREL